MYETLNLFVSNLNELTENKYDNLFDEFVSLIQKVIDNHAPFRQRSPKEKKLGSKPWITKGIYNSIRRKNRMHKSHYAMGDNRMKQEYKSFANKLTKIKTIAKKKYYAEQLKMMNVILEKLGKFYVHYSLENLPILILSLRTLFLMDLK